MTCARGGSPRSSARPVPARRGWLRRSRAGRAGGWARTCGGSISARWGRVASSPRLRARSPPRRCPAARPWTGSRRGSARRPACSCLTTASTSSRRQRRSPPGCSGRARTCGSSRPAASRCGSARSASTGSRGSTWRPRPACSVSAQRRLATTRPHGRPTTPPRSLRSLSGSTACRWPSSSPRRSCDRSPSPSSRADCESGSRCSTTVLATRPRGSGRSSPLSRGATSSWRPLSNGCCGGSPCSRAVSTRGPPRRWPVATASTPPPSCRRWRGSSTRRCWRADRRATDC